MSYTVTSKVPRTLASGRPVAPGDSISDREAEQNQRLIDEGVLRKDAPRRSSTKSEKKEPSTASSEAPSTDSASTSDAPNSEEA